MKVTLTAMLDPIATLTVLLGDIATTLSSDSDGSWDEEDTRVL
jgi:hypothetical protein